MNPYFNRKDNQNMKYTFEMHVNNYHPILISFDKDIPMLYCYKTLVAEIVNNTKHSSVAIKDIFAVEKETNNILTLKLSPRMTIEEFIGCHPNFFPVPPLATNLYTIFVIDHEYVVNQRATDYIPSSYTPDTNETKTTPWTRVSHWLSEARNLVYL
mgnify:CR=1 FL=1